MERKAEDFRDRVSSWGELAELIEDFSYFTKHDWLFRGVTDVGHGLIPKIGQEQTRALRTRQKKRVPYRIEDERAVFAMFKQQARPHLPSAPRTPLEWLAIAQHFGLPTRLLDWTDSLLAAAFLRLGLNGAGRPKDEQGALSVLYLTPICSSGMKGPMFCGYGAADAIEAAPPTSQWLT